MRRRGVHFCAGARCRAALYGAADSGDQEGGAPPATTEPQLTEVDVQKTLEDAGVKVGGLTGGVAPIGDVDLYLSPNGDACKRKE